MLPFTVRKYKISPSIVKTDVVLTTLLEIIFKAWHSYPSEWFLETLGRLIDKDTV